MLETLVSSKIRRALLEYILTHSTTRFYLRGLAKELGVAVSPLRRELKRLEQLGLLKAYDEANIRFYVVDQQSPNFAELERVSRAEAPLSPVEPLVSSSVLSHAKVERIRQALSPRPSVMAISAATLGIVVVVALGIMVASLVATQKRLVWLTHQAVTAPRSQVTVVESTEPKPAGAMGSSRWRVMPGTMGGFSAGSSEGTY